MFFIYWIADHWYVLAGLFVGWAITVDVAYRRGFARAVDVTFDGFRARNPGVVEPERPRPV